MLNLKTPEKGGGGGRGAWISKLSGEILPPSTRILERRPLKKGVRPFFVPCRSQKVKWAAVGWMGLACTSIKHYYYHSNLQGITSEFSIKICLYTTALATEINVIAKHERNFMKIRKLQLLKYDNLFCMYKFEQKCYSLRFWYCQMLIWKLDFDIVKCIYESSPEKSHSNLQVPRYPRKN